jgi:hypothetical protein
MKMPVHVLAVFVRYLVTKFFGSVIMMHTLTIFSHQNDVLRFHFACQSDLLFYSDTKVATSDRDILTTDVKFGF